MLVLFQQMPKKRTPAARQPLERARVVLDGERAFDAEKERDFPRRLGRAELGRGARAGELVG